MNQSFRISPQHLVDVYETQPVRLKFNDGVIHNGIAHGGIDHPKFTALREKLGKLGFIRIERGWWNGDRVLKAFRLNGHPFCKGDAFPCSSALGIKLYIKNENR